MPNEEFQEEVREEGQGPTQEPEEDFRAKYEAAQAEWAEKERAWNEDKEKLSTWANMGWQYDKYFQNVVDPVYNGNRNQFDQELKEFLLSKAQHGNRAEKQEAKEQLKEAYEQTGDPGYLTKDQVAQLLQERDSYFQNMIPQAFQQMADPLYQHFEKRILDRVMADVLPHAFSLYDDTTDIFRSHAQDPDFNREKFVEFMTQKKMNPKEAYAAMYGDRDRKREIEAAEKKAYEKAKNDLAAQINKDKVKVLHGSGVMPKGSNNPPLDPDAQKAAALRDLVQRRGNFINDID